MYVLIDR